MMTRDFETQLDDALAQFARGAPPSKTAGRDPEANDLISLAEHLQILAPTPEPRLADGRSRFLQEAVRTATPRGESRLRLSLAVATMIVLIVGTVLAIVIMGLTGSYTNPNMQATLTPTHAPTAAVVPNHALSSASDTFDTITITSDAGRIRTPLAVPAPAPQRQQSPVYHAISTLKIVISSERSDRQISLFVEATRFRSEREMTDKGLRKVMTMPWCMRNA